MEPECSSFTSSHFSTGDFGITVFFGKYIRTSADAPIARGREQCVGHLLFGSHLGVSCFVVAGRLACCEQITAERFIIGDLHKRQASGDYGKREGEEEMSEKELNELARNWLNCTFTSKLYGPVHPSVKSLAALFAIVQQRATWSEQQRDEQRKKLGKFWLAVP